MTFDEFKKDALRTENTPEQLNFSLAGLAMVLKASLGMARIADQAKKTMIYGKVLDQPKVLGMIADLQSTLELMAQRIGKLEIPEDTASHLAQPNMRITHGAIGMFGEAGELIEALLKEMNTGELDLVNVAEETGDSDWYKVLIHDETGISEEVCRAKVIAKLKARYGDKFTTEAALNRDLDAERLVLETTAEVPVAVDAPVEAVV